MFDIFMISSVIFAMDKLIYPFQSGITDEIIKILSINNKSAIWVPRFIVTCERHTLVGNGWMEAAP